MFINIAITSSQYLKYTIICAVQVVGEINNRTRYFVLIPIALICKLNLLQFCC